MKAFAAIREYWFTILCVYGILSAWAFPLALLIEFYQWRLAIFWTLTQPYFWLFFARNFAIFTLVYFLSILTLTTIFWEVK